MSQLLPNQVYVGLYEIIKDSKLYYNSSIGPNYSHLTEDGEKAVLFWINLMAPEMIQHETAMLDARAKKMVIDELKK